MRTITTAQQAVLDSGFQSEHVRMFVRDGGDTFRDLTTYPGFNALEEVNWKSAINSPHGEFDAKLKREVFALSLAPLMGDSALNLEFGAAGYSPLIQVGREMYIEVAIVGPDRSPSTDDWMEVFRGIIDHVDAVETMSIGGMSTSGRLARQFIKKELVYSYAVDGGDHVPLTIWQPEMDVVSGQYILPASRGTNDSGVDKFFVVASPGTTGLVEPTWTTGTGITDGSCTHDYVGAPGTSSPVEDVMQSILDIEAASHGDPTVTLAVPTTPAWDITEFIQQRGFTWESIAALAGQIGWVIQDRWSEGDEEFQLTLYEPDRSATDEAYTFGPQDYEEPRRAEVSMAEIRNSGSIIYRDASDPWPDGTGKRKTISDTVPASIAKYKQELWGEIQEDENGNIDSPTEANAMLQAFLSDCSEPDVALQVDLVRGFPWGEVNDLYEFTANRTFSSSQKLAATDIQQSFVDGHLRTTLGCRGKPTAGHEMHLRKIVWPGAHREGGIHRLEQFQGRKTPTLVTTPTVGGARVAVHFDVGNFALPPEQEFHVSRDPAFVPDETTLVAVSAAQSLEISDLVPLATYYVKTIPRYRNAGQVVRGQPSAAYEFVPAQAFAGHLDPRIEWGRMPLNGGFETWSDQYVGGGIVTPIPDNWTKSPDIDWLTTAITRQQGADGVSGDSWLRYPAGSPSTTGFLYSNPFMVEKGTEYDVTWWTKIVGTPIAGQISLGIAWIDESGDLVTGLLGVDFIDNLFFDGTSSLTSEVISTGVWYRRGATATAPDGARFASVVIIAASSGDMELDIDSVRCDRS